MTTTKTTNALPVRRPLALGLCAMLWAPLGAPAQQTSYESLNACDRVPSSAVAEVVSGRPVDARPINIKGFTAARCVYGVDIGGTRHVFVVWVNPVDDFDGLRDASDGPLTEVNGVGDEAFATIDPDTKRIQVTARVRGRVTVQVTSERTHWAQAVARVALAKFQP